MQHKFNINKRKSMKYRNASVELRYDHNNKIYFSVYWCSMYQQNLIHQQNQKCILSVYAKIDTQ